MTNLFGVNPKKNLFIKGESLSEELQFPKEFAERIASYLTIGNGSESAPRALSEEHDTTTESNVKRRITPAKPK